MVQAEIASRAVELKAEEVVKGPKALGPLTPIAEDDAQEITEVKKSERQLEKEVKTNLERNHTNSKPKSAKNQKSNFLKKEI